MNKKERLQKGLLKLGEVAKKANLPEGTIRHYSNIGLIQSSETTPGGFRLFDEKNTLSRIALIKKLSAQGKSLEEIKTVKEKDFLAKDILIVDDDIEVSDLIKDLLKDKIKANIRVAYDGFLAGKMLDDAAPDLMILDLHLPGVDGFKICKNTRQDPHFTSTKILAVTGYDSAESQEKIAACGADAYLTKPFETAEMLSLIEKLLA